jgi:hypothetical protein
VGRAHVGLPKPLAALPTGFTTLETWTADRVPATMRRLERRVTPRGRAEVDSCSRSEAKTHENGKRYRRIQPGET